MKKLALAALLLAAAALVIVSCTRASVRQQPAQWTPPPVSGALAIGTPAAEVTETPAPVFTAAPAQEAILPTLAAPAASPTAVVPTAAPTAVATVAPTRDPHLVIITERDILNAVSTGAVAQQGATLDNLAVRFTGDGRMILTAGRVGYGFVSADDVTLVGRLVAVDGKLQLQTESIAPRGIVTSFIPTLANQALQQFTSQWYIENVRTTEGQTEIRVR